MFVMNNGALLHTQHGSLKSGLNEVGDKTWPEMKKDLKKHLESKRVTEGKPAPKKEDKKPAPAAK